MNKIKMRKLTRFEYFFACRLFEVFVPAHKKFNLIMLHADEPVFILSWQSGCAWIMLTVMTFIFYKVICFVA